MKAMTVQDIEKCIRKKFEGVEVSLAYSETTFFYNPGRVLPRGVYFLTIKEKDGPNDQESGLSRDGVFRVSFKPKPATYQRFFGARPKRSIKSTGKSGAFLSSDLDQWMPHAIYAWMGWTMVLSPTQNTWDQLWPYIEESYEQAKEKFVQRCKRI